MLVKLGDQNYNISFNMNALSKFKEETDIDIITLLTSSSSGDVNPINDLGTNGLLLFSYCCIKEGERIEGRDVTLEDVGEHLDLEGILEIFEMFTKSFTKASGAKKKAKIGVQKS